MLNNLALILLSAYSGVIILLAVRDSKKGQSADFIIGERNVGWFGIMSSLTGNLRDGAGLAAWIVLSIYFGFGAIWLTVGLSLGLLVLSLIANQVRELASKHDIISITQFVDLFIGRKTTKIATFYIVGTAFLYSAAQVWISGRIIGSILGLPDMLGVLITSIIVSVYLVLGGFRTTITTGIFQWFTILLILILPWLMAGSSVQFDSVASIFSINFVTSFSFVMISFLVVTSSADIWQLIFSARNKSSIQRGLLTTIPVYFIISIAIIIFSIVLVSSLGASVDPNEALFLALESSQIPNLVSAVIGVFVAAAIMSTLDSQVFLFASTIIREFTGKEIESGDRSIQRKSRITILVTMIVLSVIASAITDIVDYLFDAVTLATILSPLFILVFFRKPVKNTFNDNVMSFGLLISGAVYVYLFISNSFQDLVFNLIPATISFVFVCYLMINGKGEHPFDNVEETA